MGKETIYKTLISAGMTPTGACAVMGNMQAESALRSDNAQDGMTSLTDATYTQMVNVGTYTRFITDGVGYGLIQWTFHSRKEALLNYAKKKGVSIANEKMQTEFCVKELKQDYPALWKYLCTTSDLYTATSRVCKEFERPAINNIDVRHNFAKALYAELSKLNVKATTPTADELAELDAINANPKPAKTEANPLKDKLTNETVMHLQSILKTYGYDIGKSGVDGLIGSNTKTALKKFAADLEAV